MAAIDDKMYLARDRDNGLFLYEEKPERDTDAGFWMCDCGFVCLDENIFPELSWNDEPMAVKVSIEKII